MTLANPPSFFDKLRSGLLGPSLSPSEVSGVQAILGACEGLPLAYVADALGTAYLETNHEMQPIREIGSDAYLFRMYDPHGNRPGVAAVLGNTQPGDGVRFPGMGYVQSTGRKNAQRATVALKAAGFDVDLEKTPELLMRPDIAAFVMRNGMLAGWFTGRGFARYLPAKGPANRGQFTNARAIINGSDRADDVAEYSLQFQDALTVGGWA